jgi:hypothetical protein
MTLFHLLNRAVRLTVALVWCVAFWAVWQHREQARPLVDFYELWRDVKFEFPKPLPRLTARVLRVNNATSLHLQDTNGAKWNIGLIGLAPNPAITQPREIRQRDREIVQWLGARLGNEPVEVAHTILTPLGTGLGFVYQGTNLIQHELVREGRLQLMAEPARILPLREQYALRIADRKARAEEIGIWAPKRSPTNSPPPPRNQPVPDPPRDDSAAPPGQ